MLSNDEIYRRQKLGLAWLVAYLVTTGAIVWAVYALRARAMEQLDTPEARGAMGRLAPERRPSSRRPTQARCSVKCRPAPNRRPWY